MKFTKLIKIGNKTFKVAIAKTDELRYTGLSNVDELPEDAGMLFVYDEPQDELWYTMEDTSIDLDIIFIDEEGAVTSVHPMNAYDKEPVYDEEENAQFVLEVNKGSGIKIGDELEDYDESEESESNDEDDSEDFSEDDKKLLSKSKMLVLNSNGDVLMKLVGGERIVSMIKTRQLIKAALKAYHSDNDSDYIRVGKLIFKELDALDGRDPEYVEKKN